MTQRQKTSKTWAALAAAMFLAACGGGDGGSSAGGGGATELALSGSAATDEAIAGKSVQAKCATGSSSATTAADGRYAIAIVGGRLPCVLQVSAADGSVLHTVALGSGATATAQLTPATELVVARLTAADPTSYYVAFDATAAAALTGTGLASAQAAVLGTLKAGGVDFGAVTDLVAGAFKPSTATTVGDAYDAALDALKARLTTSGLTLPALTASVVTEAANLGITMPSSAAVVLPAAMLLQPAAGNCSALRSGAYRVIAPMAGSQLTQQTGLLTLNATTLVSRDAGSTTDNAAWTPNGLCRFLTDGGTTDIAVSQAGVVAFRASNGGTPTRRIAIAFPEQTHTLAELAGTWNLIGLERNDANTGYTAAAGTATLDGSGTLSAVTFCRNDATWGLKGADCTSVTSGLPTLRLNAAAGGFERLDAGATSAGGRHFAYRAGNGDLMMVGVDGDGSVTFWTRLRTNALPTVGATTTSWNFYTGNQMTSTQAVEVTSNTIASVDEAAARYLRNQSTVGQNFTRPETLFVNNPRNGYNFRVGETVTTSIGTSVAVNEFTSLPLRGMGLSGQIIPGPRLLLLSVTQP